MDRALLQLQSLVDQYNDKAPLADNRVRTYFVVDYPCQWMMERELGDQFLSFGAVRSALDLYLKLRHYPGIIRCYQSMDQVTKVLTCARTICLVGFVSVVFFLFSERDAGQGNHQRTTSSRAKQPRVVVFVG